MDNNEIDTIAIKLKDSFINTIHKLPKNENGHTHFIGESNQTKAIRTQIKTWNNRRNRNKNVNTKKK